MTISIKKTEEAIKLLQTYEGNNQYLKILKFNLGKKDKTITDFEIDYVLKNINFQPLEINKVVKIIKWFGEKKQEQWGINFTPEKVLITQLLGETDNTFHVYLKYKQNQEKPVMCFIPKSALLDDFLIKDYQELDIDFNVYNEMLSGVGRKVLPHQKPAVQFLLSRKKCLLADDQGLGKMEYVENKLFTPYGRKRIGDIKVGDKVIGSNGKACNVTGVFPKGEKDLYKVTFNDGYSILVGGEHLWAVTNPHGDGKTKNRNLRTFTLTTDQMLDKDLVIEINGTGRNINKKYKYSTYYKYSDNNPRWKIPIVEPIEFFNENEPPIDPYLFGLCLGDGHFTEKSCRFQVHQDDYDEMFNSFNIKENKKPNETMRSGSINLGDNLINFGLDNKNSYEKRIPDIFKYSTIENRLSILQGLMDSDGHCMFNKKNPNIFEGTEYVSTSKELADDVAEIVHSLGGIVRTHEYVGAYKKDGVKRICRKYYRLNIKLSHGMNPFRLKRKSEKYSEPQKYQVARYIKNIEYYGKGEAVCIKVDSEDHLYVTEHAIVTHNTTETVIAALEGEFKKILVICPASLKTNWCKEIRFLNPNEDIAVIEGEKRENWISDKRFTIINYDIIDSYYTIPTEVVDGKVVKSRKKAVIQKAMSQSNLFTEGFDLLIIDEVHKLSNNSSIRYKVIEDFIKKTKIQHVFLMTGTPVTNDPINLYHILKLIDHPITRDYAYYAKQFCNGFQITKKDTGRKIWITKGSSNEEELKEKIKDVYLRRVKEDIEGMVKKTIHERYYELTNEEKTIYDGLWDEYEQSQNELGNYNLNKDLIEGIFLRQFISNSMVKNTIKLTDEFLEKGKKVLIACCFKDEITQLKEYFGDKAVIYKGGMTSKKKNEAVEKFMDDPNTTVFIGNMIAAGVGLTLTSSNIGIFNSYDWTYYNTIQFVDRLHRVGAKEDVNIYFQLYRNTISEDMWEKVIRKQIMSDSIIKKETEK